MHADWRGVQDRVKSLVLQSAARNSFAADGFGQFSRCLFAAGANRNVRACARKSEPRRSRNAACAEDQDAPPVEPKLVLERPQNPNVIGIAAEERTIAE